MVNITNMRPYNTIDNKKHESSKKGGPIWNIII